MSYTKQQVEFLERLTADPAAFRDALIISTAGKTRTLGNAMDPWQRDDFAALDPAWRRLCGQKVEVPFDRAWEERAKGHSKTLDAAVSAVWPLAFSRHRLNGLAAAADEDQARLLLGAIDKLLALNPWLRSLLSVQQRSVLNKETGSRLDFISSDVASSHGHTPDFLIVDELCNWTDRGEALWHSLYAGADKQPNWCVVLVISNAGCGEGDSWQWKAREAARLSDWYFHTLPGSSASWLTPEALERQRRMLPDGVFRRLWLNEWTSGAGDALSQEDIDAALMLPGPSEREPSATYIAGLDLGLAHDYSSLVLLAKQGTRYKLARAWEWRPPRGGKVSIEAIEETLVAANRRYSIARIAADPWQAAQLIERCQRRGMRMEAREQSGKNLVVQAVAMLEAFRSRSIALYDFPPLTSDLRRLRVEERQYGYRLVSDKGADGHGDRASALSIALAAARDVIATGGLWGGLKLSDLGGLDVGRQQPDQYPVYLEKRNFIGW